ncbi:ATP-binding cassette domain-containing protein [Amycolatopsis sp. WQ 127309]|uniref:branched-chain amino acid ABC transporter ATP-binding protein/permease n=1 Tax=Amycolatopsis sp. WQ 127309 TaxID=2932773 RepID=UPI001FF41CBE|nr:branched-chain amino acid ABC transporter ATP-binding protein/permease [Amycolatopsis sp. WQ 127309]UOZ03446.1 branched-chain amino acid ABC transporter ATP-binding protein/permease [Amycolatopsis sp. WQ 127309]
MSERTTRLTGRLLVLAAAILLLVYPVVSDDAYYQNMIILSLVFAVGAGGLNIIAGFAGYVSLGQGAFIGLGGYTIGVLATRFDSVPPWLWVPVAGLVAVAVSFVLGLVSLRARGPSFVIITVAFLFLVQVIAVNWAAVTGGTAGITLPLPTWDRDIINWPFYYVLALILAAQLLLTWWIRRTKLGMGLIAIRDDETKAATIGINLPVQKIIGFVASSVFVGMAGAVYGYYLTFIDPRGMFGILLSVQVVLSLLLGGRGTLWGPVLGAFLVEPLNEIANNDFGGGNTRLFLFGGLLIAVVIGMPQGILPTVERLLHRRRTKEQPALVGARIGVTGTPVDEMRQPPARPVPPRADAPPLLEISGLVKRFGGITAVDGCSLVVPEGSITGLIGPNGSGKTTVFNLIDNTIRADAGRITFAGERIERLPSWERAHRGIGRTFQATRLFGEMTVLENVVAAQRSFTWRGLGRIAVSGKEAAAADELLEFAGMRAFRDQKAHALSYGQQKLVELAQVLMLDPKLILLDEPAGGINPVLIERMGEMFRTLNERGKTLLIVEHNMPFVLGLCDPVHVLARGATMASGTPAQIRTDPAVVEAYLGEDFQLETEGVG